MSCFSTSTEERLSLEDIHPDDVKGLLAHGIPPFPYKVAKSLDPDIYRNIEYDAWNTVRRGEKCHTSLIIVIPFTFVKFIQTFI